MTIEIIDNFISDNEYKNLYKIITSSDFPWYFNPDKVSKNDGIFQLTHCFFCDNTQSNFVYLIRSIYEALNISSPIQIKANTTFGRVEKLQTDFHIDFCDLDTTKRKTAVFYLSDTNGPLLIKNKKQEIECKQNRLVRFDSNIEHAAILHQGDSSSRRIVINFNYY